MARTAVPYTSLPANSGIAIPAGTALDVANGHTIAAAVPEKTVLYVTNTSGSAKNVTIKAGTYPPALAKGLGDLVVSVGTGGAFIGPFESGRFLQSDGSLSVDLAASHTGVIAALNVPRNA